MEEQNGVVEYPAVNPEMVDGAINNILETPEAFPSDVVEKAKRAKGRKKLPEINSAAITAVDTMQADIETAEQVYSDGMPYELDRIENEIRFYQAQAGTALLEMGKRFIRIKAHEGHGKFIESLDRLGMAPRSAQYAMLAARKFANAPTLAHLDSSKTKALTVLDEDDIKTLESGGAVAGITLDDIDRMTMRELRENLRNTEDKIKKEKEARKKDRAAFKQSMLQKDAKINEMDMRLAGQEPPTKEQAAQAELNAMLPEYSIAVAKVNGAIREAYALVIQAEKIEGVNVQQLSEWLNEFSPDMQTFHNLVQTWMDEVDNAGPVEGWQLSDLPGGEE